MQSHHTNITKRSGDVVPFDVNKLIRSLERSGAGEQDIQRVVEEVQRSLVDGMSTHKVYQLAYSILRKKSNRIAGKYRLKKAIFDLGPTGYPFERFVGALLEHQGYRVEVGKIVQGRCVQHEVDVIAEKDDRKFMIECKFHSDPGRKSDVKVSLYIHSRFLDIEEQWKKQPSGNAGFHQGWIVTNTRFTDDALQYGKCAGLNMISWDYPSAGSLKQRIDQSGLHPITALQSLTKREKQDFLEKDLVLCRNLNKQALESIGIKLNRMPQILREISELINPD
ncbi:MAG: restriction endonuclease [Bacteroidetes bacterium]|nr:restriction endonuclease [Bacteroidota bacterium]